LCFDTFMKRYCLWGRIWGEYGRKKGEWSMKPRNSSLVVVLALLLAFAVPQTAKCQ